MPYKSRAQQGFLHAAAARGDVPRSLVKDFDKATTEKQFKRLPEHVKKASGGVIPDGYEITNEGDKHFDVKGPRGSFRVAKRGLGKRTADELHQHFSRGGQVQKLAEGDEVKPSITGDPETDRMFLASSGASAAQGVAPVFTGDPSVDQRIASRSPPLPMTGLGVPTITSRGYEFPPQGEPVHADLSPHADDTPAQAALRADMARRASEIDAQTAFDRDAGRPVVPESQGGPPAVTPASSSPDNDQLRADYMAAREAERAPTDLSDAATVNPAQALSGRQIVGAPQAQAPTQTPKTGGGGGGGGGLLGAGFEAQKKANLDQANIAKAESDSMAQAQQDIAARGEQIRKDFETRRAANQQIVDTTRQQIADGTINPNRFWEKKDTGSKIQAAIAVALGGFAAGLRGDGRNTALEIINKAIDRDVDAQKANLGKTESLLSSYMQQGNSLEQSEQLARAHLMDVAGEQMRLVATKYAGPKAMAIAEAQNGALSVQAQQIRMQQAAMGQEGALKGLQIEQAKLGMAAQRQQMELQRGLLMGGGKIDSRAVPFLSEDQRERAVNNGDGTASIVRTKEDATAIKTSSVKMQGLSNLLANPIRGGWTGLMPGNFSNEEAKKWRDEVAGTLSEMGESVIGGAQRWSPQKIEFFMKRVPDFTALTPTGKRHAEAELMDLRNSLLKDQASIMKTYGTGA